MLKIVFTTDGIFPYSIGGIQRHSRLLIQELAKDRNIQITVIHPHIDVKVFPEKTNIREIAIEDIDTQKLYLTECYKYSQRVYDAIKDIDYDIIYSQGISVWYNINKIRMNLVVNPHGLEAFQAISLKDRMIGFPFRLIQLYIFSKAKYIASEGGHLTRILRKFGFRDKIVFLPNAVNLPDLKHVRDWSKRKTSVLFVGRFAFNKGINILMSAIEELNAEGFQDKFVFNLAGKGPLFDHYSNKFKLTNLNYLGFVPDDDLENTYLNNDLFVLPTLFEGMPTVVLEAMSCKMPVIVTDVGATSELVDISNGYLIEKNNVQALKDALLSFSGLSSQEKNILAENSYDKVEKNFTWKQLAKKHIELFQAMKG
jgi:glycosyltransferase involved in cell wall biosynthesis